MSLRDVVLPKRYKNGRILFEETLDFWRLAAEAGFQTVNKNLTQLRKDCFLSNYDYDNDGNANLALSLQQQINNLISGATPITGSSSDSFTINSDGNSANLDTSLLTDDRIFTFPDVSGIIVVKTNGGSFGLPPIGTILPHYDFNALAAAVPDVNYWRYCNGSVLVYASSPLNGLTLPDLSNRYLVGFGTEAGGDISTAAWNAAAVGNASHQVNLQHSHTVNAHTHSTDIAHGHANTITASVPAHYHSATGITANISGIDGAHPHSIYGDNEAGSGGVYIEVDDDAANTRTVTTGITGGDGTHGHTVTIAGSTSSGAGSNGDAAFAATMGGGVTSLGATSVASGGASNSGTNNQLSATFDVQPRSIRVRFIMRVL